MVNAQPVTVASPPASHKPTLNQRHLRPDQKRAITITWVTLLFVTVLTMFPIFWIVMTSLNVGDSFASGFLPSQYTLSHYADVIEHTDFLLWIRNTLIVGLISGVIEVAIVTLLAYAFSRFKFRGQRYGLIALLAMQMFPTVSFLTAWYYIVNWVTQNWFPIDNNWVGLIIIYAGQSVPYMSWLFKGYIDTLPFALEESAYIDGAGRFSAFWQVIAPLCRPMMAVVFIQGFLGVANEYLIVSVLVSDPSRKTFSYGLFDFANGSFSEHWTNFAAAAVMGALPFVLIFVFTQRWLVAGLAGGAVKG